MENRDRDFVLCRLFAYMNVLLPLLGTLLDVAVSFCCCCVCVLVVAVSLVLFVVVAVAYFRYVFRTLLRLLFAKAAAK